MRTLAHSARRAKRDSGGQFLPVVFPALEARGIRARLGTATIIMGPPGAFKTGFAMYYALRLNLPTLYWSADAEDFETVERAAAAVTGVTMREVAQDYAKYEDDLSFLDNVRFVYGDSPTYDDLVLDLAAYHEIQGEFPKVLVIDNLMNVSGEQENEWASMRDTAKVIHKLTRITGAAVFVLHHASDDRTDPSVPAPRKSLQGKISQLPKAIWSVALANNGTELRLCPVKNRWAGADPTGNDYVTLYADPGRSRIYNDRTSFLAGNPA